MDKLLESYGKDVAAMEKIADARKALIDLYMSTVRYSMELNLKGYAGEVPIKEVAAARRAVNTLNAMCQEKGLAPVYTAKDTDVYSLFDYAKEFTAKAFEKAISNK